MELRERLQETLGNSLILEQELGGGGMSRVFVANEAALGRKVVVKVLPPEMAAAVSIDRFRREIQLAAQLQHPHIVPLLSAGETYGLPYFTMPYVRGESLRARLVKGGELPLSETIRILREVASALAYAHEAGIVHRDIKPENILISGGSAVVTDFGVAKALTASSGAHGGTTLTSLGIALGTPAYMSPEQATADPSTDRRADIYSLGVVAYEMLSGGTPFSGRSPQAILAAHVTEAPDAIVKRRPTVPPALGALVMRCLEKRASDRPQSAADVMHELDALSTPSGDVDPTSSIPARPKPTARRMIVTGAALVGLVTLAVAASMAVERQAKANAEKSPAIAVLPFENVGRKEGQDFADGMTEEITNRLASLRGLRVIGRQSAKGYVGSTKTPQEIANELGVKYILTGTVRWDQSQDGKVLVRVSPALLRSDDATQVWAEAYQTVLSGMFEVQGKVATQVANALNVTLLSPEREALAKRPTSNVEAYGLYLRGKEMLERTSSAPQLREAIAYLDRAAALDKKFALAWAFLAIAHTEYFWFQGDPTPNRLRLASAALDRAEALDPESADLHIARGIFLYHGQRDYENALNEFAIAERSRPNDYNILLYKGSIERRQGKWEDAAVSLKRAFDLEPRYGQFAKEVAETLRLLLRYEEAEQYADRAMALNPEEADIPYVKAILAIDGRGNVPEAVEHLRNAVTKVKPHSDLVGLLLLSAWPAAEDPSLRQLIIDAPPLPDIPAGNFYFNKARLFWYLKDQRRTLAYADTAISALLRVAASSPRAADAYMSLSFAQAVRGRRSEALRAIQLSEQVLPKEKDAFIASERMNQIPTTYVLLGDKEAAISAIEQRVGARGGMSRNRLRLDPMYASLRGNPRFERLVQTR